MVTVTGFMISSMFIDIITLVIERCFRLARILQRDYVYVAMKRLLNSGNALFKFSKRVYEKLMGFNTIYRYSRPFIPPPLPKRIVKNYKVCVVVPAYNEEENIEACIKSVFDQTKKPSHVIVIDDCSTDRTVEVCRRLMNKHRNFHLIRQKKNRGKAYNLSQVIKNYDLGDITIVLDADTFLASNYIEEITKPFHKERVVVSTGISTPLKSPNTFGKIIFRGSVFQYLFFCFRKEAQAIRNAVSVIAGDSAAYRSTFLKKMGGFPDGTVTEDMDLTWKALEMGYEISFQGKAYAQSRDPITMKGHWKQLYRWYSGGFQCLFRHGRKLLKAKSLLFTSLMPTYFDIFVYSPLFLLGPILIFFFTELFMWFYIFDFLFTIGALLYVDKKLIQYIPEIYVIKFIWSAVWLTAAFRTTFEYIGGKRVWASKWSRDYSGLRRNPKTLGKI